MGLLDGVLGGALGSLLGGQKSSLIDMALGLIRNNPQGLQGLVEQFARSGLGAHAQSWVGSGQNMSITADQLTQALGSGPLAQLAEQFGLSGQHTASGLAAVLPQVIDHLTPGGQMPQSGDLDQLLQSLKSKL